MRLLFLFSVTLTASASVILGPGTFSNVSGTSVVNTPVQGNNNHPGGNSPNTIAINETASIFPTVMGVSFNVLADNGGIGGSTEYAVTKTVLNNTGQTWTSFAMALNYTFLSGPITAANLVVVQFDEDSIPTLAGNGTAGQSLSTLTSNQVSWSGLNIQPGDALTISFSVDTCPSCNGTWQLLQAASASDVPEPRMFALVGLGLIGLRLRSNFRR